MHVYWSLPPLRSKGQGHNQTNYGRKGGSIFVKFYVVRCLSWFAVLQSVIFGCRIFSISVVSETTSRSHQCDTFWSLTYCWRQTAVILEAVGQLEMYIESDTSQWLFRAPVALSDVVRAGHEPRKSPDVDIIVRVVRCGGIQLRR